MATPQTPQPASRSVLKRYAPFIAVVVVLAVVVLVIALVSGGDDNGSGSVSTNTGATGDDRHRLQRRPDLLQRGEGAGHARRLHVAGALRHRDG